MSKVQMLRAFVNQRLTAAAEEIFELFERTIAEYEEELELRSKENHRQLKLMDAADCDPKVGLLKTDVQQLLVVEEDVPPEQQEWSSSLDQEDPEPMNVKVEQGELWTSREGGQLQWLQEADIKFTFTSVPVKSEKDGEKAQSSQLYESQTEENREAERTGADGEDWGGPEPARNSDPDSLLQPATHDKTADSSESETDDSGDWEESRSGSNPLQNNEGPGSDEEPLKKRTGVQTGGKPFCCLVCGKRFFLNKTLTAHMRLHSEGILSSCPVCELVCSNRSTLVKHMTIHTGEKQFNCSLCSKQFAQKQNLRQHLIVHKGNKPFSCSVCSKTFTQKGNLKKHMAIHTGEKPFSCSFCSKRFTQKGNLKQHLAVHTREKPFSCSVCGERFTQKGHLKQHLSVHTGEIILI